MLSRVNRRSERGLGALFGGRPGRPAEARRVTRIAPDGPVHSSRRSRTIAKRWQMNVTDSAGRWLLHAPAPARGASAPAVPALRRRGGVSLPPLAGRPDVLDRGLPGAAPRTGEPLRGGAVHPGGGGGGGDGPGPAPGARPALRALRPQHGGHAGVRADPPPAPAGRPAPGAVLRLRLPRPAAAPAGGAHSRPAGSRVRGAAAGAAGDARRDSPGQGATAVRPARPAGRLHGGGNLPLHAGRAPGLPPLRLRGEV